MEQCLWPSAPLAAKRGDGGRVGSTYAELPPQKFPLPHNGVISRGVRLCWYHLGTYVPVFYLIGNHHDYCI